ncbi:MAG: hypothetical protein O8C65_04935 [Candidatus Methanoperedens sp.]|nr:hypothetical protein [Candidatus Methanoperedens sp.]
MVKCLKKEPLEAPTHPLVAERELGLSPEEKQTVKKIMFRNDKVLRMLAEM